MIEIKLIIKINGTKLEKVTILQRFFHNVCIFSNYSFKDFKMVN